MEKSFSESYKAAGVDVTAGYKAVELMKAHVARTKTSGCISGIGGFGGLFGLDLTGMLGNALHRDADGQLHALWFDAAEIMDFIPE